MKWFANRYVTDLGELMAELTYSGGYWDWEVFYDPGEALAHGREIYLKNAKSNALKAMRGLATAIRARGAK